MFVSVLLIMLYYQRFSADFLRRMLNYKERIKDKKEQQICIFIVISFAETGLRAFFCRHYFPFSSHKRKGGIE